MIVGFDWDVGKRGGIGAEFTMAFGAILDPAEDPKNDYTRKPVTYTLGIRKQESANVHFKFGSAILETMGKALVRSFCAVWLRWVDSPESQLTVIGHADSVDSPERNRDLSRMRAQNVIQAMKDVLGPKLRIPESRIIAQAWGECDAYFHGEEDSRNRKFRRVDVALDGHCVLTLWVA